MKRVGILMAGGAGERFWPISRQKRPKQLLRLNTNKPLIQESIERITSIIPKEDVFIITNDILVEPIRNALKSFPHENVIPEPSKKNTAPCLALACGFVTAKYGKIYKPEEITFGIFTSDQKIEPIDGFKKTVLTAFQFVEDQGYLATIGIIPSRPDTAYGYIEVGKSITDKNSEILNVARFHEKPNIEKAKEYVGSGRYFWNSGMFFWRLDTFIEEFNLHCPIIAEKIPLLTQIFKGKTDAPLNKSLNELYEIYSRFPEISIDYALMEKSQKIVVVKASFEWDDIGSWDALDRTKSRDGFGNVNLGNNLVLDTKNTIIFNNSINGKIKVATIGVSNFVVVVDEDAVLICPKNQVQKVKSCVEILKNSPDGQKWL
ncbi:MAG: mannose-1-phosphate guanylyltransferase [Candidatus Kapaibacteriales bacterium]